MSSTQIPKELLYSREDEWARVEDHRVVVGITDYAQDQLGDIVFVELPEIGKPLEIRDVLGAIESVKAVSDLYAPVAGTIVEVNRQLEDKPEIVNEDCYGDGWMCVIEIAGDDALADLIDAAAYAQHCADRAD